MRVNSKKSVIESGSKPTIHNVNLLDRSGSMAENNKYTISVLGINEEASLLKKDNKANYLQTVIEFDSEAGRARFNQEIVTIPIKDAKSFVGNGPQGFTPLYEAVGYTIKKLLSLKKSEDRVLLKIFTDGGENDSNGEFGNSPSGRKNLYDLIQKVTKEDKFTITFIGTREDTESVIQNLGIERGNTYVHDNTARGVKMSSSARAGATMSYADTIATTGVDTVDNFFTKTVEEDGK